MTKSGKGVGEGGSLLPSPINFGGKRRVAAEVWRRFGDVTNFIEPFFGSGAVLLARPTPFTGVETVNDVDGLICNLWRAVKADPAAVAHHAAWPVLELDLTARHAWLVERREDITGRLVADPEWFDARAAGWWVWGACAWIGSGWCSGDGPWRVVDGEMVRAEGGARRQLPHLGDAGRGINRQLPHLGDAGRGINRSGGGLAEDGATFASPAEWIEALSARLARVRIACGDWTRVLGASVLDPGSTGRPRAVFLDPPYGEGNVSYSAGGSVDLAAVRAWAIEEGRDPRSRIALCGYGDPPELVAAGWVPHRWKTAGGYASQGAANPNQHREVAWFSPFCVGARQLGLFDAAAGQ